MARGAAVSRNSQRRRVRRRDLPFGVLGFGEDLAATLVSSTQRFAIADEAIVAADDAEHTIPLRVHDR
jgi:hypothetical protein